MAPDNNTDRRDSTPMIMEKLEDIKVIAEDNRRALRGYNGTPGMVAGVVANAKNIERLEKKSNRNDTIVGIGTILGTIGGFIFGNK